MIEVWRFRPKLGRKNSDFDEPVSSGQIVAEVGELYSPSMPQPSEVLVSDLTSPCSKVSDTTFHHGG